MKTLPFPVPPANLVQEFLENSARLRPNHPALICDRRRLSYAEINQLANRLAATLIELGVQAGDRVVIQLPNSVECVVSIFAALKAGAAFVVVHPGVKRQKLAYILNNCTASVLVTEPSPPTDKDDETLPAPSLKGTIWVRRPATQPPAAANETPSLDFEAVLATPGPDELTLPPRSGSDLACLIYTSGSTGEPKGVMSDHDNVIFASGSIISYLQMTERDVVINVLPLSFDYGLYQLLMTFRVGGTLVLERSFAYPAAILKRIETHHVTGFPGVPTLFSMLVRLDLSGFNLSSLRFLTNTAAALPASHIGEIRAKFPGATLFSMYGLTETKRTLYLPPDELDRRADSVGIPIPGTEAWVEREDGPEAAPNEVGELIVRGRHVMRGYWADPALTALRFQEAAEPAQRICRTGDLFRRDADGFFYFVGRKDDIIKSRGEKVAPREVENVLYALPGIAEAAVIGVPDPILGQAIKAFVVATNPALNAQSVLAHCRRHLEDLMVPHQVEFRTELPKTATGKINKRQLAANGARTEPL